jgi:tripartite-type tricarboxylate transporter receptor subunit TctC
MGLSATQRLGLGVCLIAGLAQTTARADSIEDFYRGKSLSMLIGVAAGGEYDLHARLIARFIGKYIAGNPNVVPQNMTGAGGIKMANYLYEVAPRDGSVLGMLLNTAPAMQAVGGQGVQYDANGFGWIGSICPTVETMTVWKTSGVKTFADAQKIEVTAGATGRGAITYSFPMMMNTLLNTKFKIVPGYPGGNDINLAMERNEVGARNNTWSSWKVTKPEWLKNKDITILVQAGPRAKDLPDVPSVEDLARSDDDRRIIELVVSGTRLGRPVATTPQVPAERLTALRKAFDATMKDAEFIKQAELINIDVDPVSGETIQSVVARVLSTPQELKDRAKPLVE